LEPIEVVAEHHHQVVAQRRVLKVRDGAAVREPNFDLRAAQILSAVAAAESPHRVAELVL
jgi:hypothetical protein